MNGLAYYIFTREISWPKHAFMNVVELWGARVPSSNGDALAQSQCYNHAVASCLRLAIGADNI